MVFLRGSALPPADASRRLRFLAALPSPSERNGLILIKWNTSMNNTHPLETALPVGLLLLIAGVCLLCHQAMTLRTLKRGRVRAGFSFRTLSFRSIYPAAIVIAIGIVLLGLSSFGTGY